jgi:hypothetical protein
MDNKNSHKTGSETRINSVSHSMNKFIASMSFFVVVA